MNLQQLLGLGTGGGLLLGAYDRLGDIGERAYTKGGEIAQQTAGMAGFKPFGVTSTLGSVNTDQEGGFSVGLSPQQQALQDLLGAGAQNFFSSAMAPREAREGDIYETIRATQRPEEQRQDLALEERLYNQGRSGVRTSMFGGTPEQLAVNKAREEAKNAAALMALQQGNAEQLQDTQLGTSFMSQQYAPQSAALNLLQTGNQTASLADIGRRTSAGLFGQGSMSGLEALLGSGLGQANLMGNLGSGLLTGLLTPQYTASGELANDVFGGVGDYLKGLGDPTKWFG